MLTTPIFTRILSTEEFGKYGVFTSWLGIATIIVSINLFYGVHAQGLVKFHKDRSAFTSSLIGLTTLLTLVWIIIYYFIQDIINHITGLTSIQVVAMLLMIWATAIFGFWANEQRVDYSYRSLVIVTIVVSIAKPTVGILFVLHFQDKVTARIIAILLVELLCYTWMLFAQIHKGKVLVSKKYWIYALGFNIPLVPHYLSQTVLNSSDRIMIQKMVGNSQAGIYNLVYSISLIMTLFNTALMQTISPWIYTKIRDRKIQDIKTIGYTSLLFIAIVNLLFILLGPEVVAIFAPNSYYDAIKVIPPVAMSVFFMYSYDLFAKFSFYYEKTKLIMTASVMGALLNIFLNFVFIRRFGYIAAGYTTLACYVLYSLLHYVFMKKVCDEFCEGIYPYETKKLLQISIPFMGMGFLLLLTYPYPFIRYSLFAVAIVVGLVFRDKIYSLIFGLLQIRKGKNHIDSN